MPQRPTLQDEYQMLMGELRQNREIQLKSLFATPIRLAVFFGLLSTLGSEILESRVPFVLIPVPLIFMRLQLTLDKRGSADRIIAYCRTAYDQGLAKDIGWNYLLPQFR